MSFSLGRAIIFAVLATAVLPAQAPQASNPPTSPQSAPMTKMARRNLDLVLDWWRDVIQARHTELAEKYQAEDYIQHNPNVPTGRAAFVKFFSGLGPAINPIPATLSPAPIVKGAKGDFVWLVFEHRGKSAAHPDGVLVNSFDLLRIEKGKIQEHWDSAFKEPGSEPFVPSTAAPASRWLTFTPTAEERQELDIATRFEKDVLQYGHVELIDTLLAPDFVLHNPDLAPTRDALRDFRSHKPGGEPQPIQAEWKRAPVLSFANGPYVVMMWAKTDKDPSDPSKEYIRNYFDVLRIENGKIREMWN